VGRAMSNHLALGIGLFVLGLILLALALSGRD
jgi:hypothetical protein